MQSALNVAIFVRFSFLLVLVLHNSEAQIAFDVPCPDVHVVRDFDVQKVGKLCILFETFMVFRQCHYFLKYSGIWFEIVSYPSIIDEFDICVSMHYTVQADGSLQVVSSWFNTR